MMSDLSVEPASGRFY